MTGFENVEQVSGSYDIWFFHCEHGIRFLSAERPRMEDSWEVSLSTGAMTTEDTFPVLEIDSSENDLRRQIRMYHCSDVISMAWCNIAVITVRQQWSYCSPLLRHRYERHSVSDHMPNLPVYMSTCCASRLFVQQLAQAWN